MVSTLCTLALLALAAALTVRAGTQLARARLTLAAVDVDRTTRATASLDAARDDVVAAIGHRRAGRDRPTAADR